jgi:hypothetical protein
MLAYKIEMRQGTQADPHRIHVADTNVPYRPNSGYPECEDPEATWIQYYILNGVHHMQYIPLGDHGSTYQYREYESGYPAEFFLVTPFTYVAVRPRQFLKTLLEFLPWSAAFLIFGDAEIEQITSKTKEYYAYQGNERVGIKRGIPGLVRMPLPDAEGAELYVQQKPFPQNLRLKVMGTNAGNYACHILVSQNLRVSLEAPTNPKEYDTIELVDFHTPKPKLKLESTCRSKQVKLKFEFQSRPDSRQRFEYEVKLGLSQAQTMVGLAKQGINLFVSPGNPKENVDISLQRKIANTVQIRKMWFSPGMDKEYIHIRPRNILDAQQGMVLEKLKTPTGGVKSRQLINTITSLTRKGKGKKTKQRKTAITRTKARPRARKKKRTA